MIARTSPLVVSWLVAQLLIASVGLPLQRLQCWCVGEATVGLWIDEHNCRVDHQPTQVEPSSCCAAKTGACQRPSASSPVPAMQCSDNCVDSEPLWSKLAVVATALPSELLTPFISPVAILPIPVRKHPRLGLPRHTGVAPSAQPPPPLPQQRRLAQGQVWRC